MRATLLALATIVLSNVGGAGQEAPSVVIDRPRPGEIAMGDVEIVATVCPDKAVTKVEYYVDDTLRGQSVRPPHRIVVNVGERPIAHRFKAIAYWEATSCESTTVTTRSIELGGEIDITLQQLYVTATLNGEPVHDLSGDEFIIEDDGQQEELITFARGDIPFTAILLVDASTSMRGDKHRAAVEGAKTFARNLHTLDEARLISFSDYVRSASPFTSFPEVLIAGLERTSAVGGTALNDVLYIALTELEERQGRRVVIILSDAVDSHSVLRMRHIVPVARRSRALTYLIRTHGGDDDDDAAQPLIATSAWRNAAGYREEIGQLLKVVADSGGKVIEISSLEDIDRAFEDVVSELRNHYVLGYYPSRRRGDGRWHKVRVEVTRPSVEIRASAGYIDR